MANKTSIKSSIKMMEGQIKELDREILATSIKLAKFKMSTWTHEELETYAFDKLVDELMADEPLDGKWASFKQ
jgi:hypothetical protein